MGKPAARMGDVHVCPMVTGIVPHVGGPIIGPGCPTVLISGQPAAVMGDMVTCVGPPDTIMLGSSGVMIGGKPAARVGDMCAHGGTIILGCFTVLIGETMPGSADGGNASAPGQSANNNTTSAITDSAQLINALNNKSLLQAAASGDGLAPKSSQKDLTAQFTLIDDAGKKISGTDYEIKTDDGAVHSGKTDSSGKTKIISGFTSSQCQVRFKNK